MLEPVTLQTVFYICSPFTACLRSFKFRTVRVLSSEVSGVNISTVVEGCSKHFAGSEVFLLIMKREGKIRNFISDKILKFAILVKIA